MQEHRREFRVAWAGIALLGALSSRPARAGDCAGGVSLDVLTYNTWGLPEPLARDRDGRLPRISRMVREESADVVGLQEVWRGATHLLDLDLLRRDDKGDNGLALVTPHPTRDERVTPFEAGYGVDRLKDKAVLSTVVELPQLGDTLVMVTHLQAGRSPGAAQARGRQIDTLLALGAQSPGNAILLGDFNLHAADPQDQASAARLQAAGWRDMAEEADDLAPTYPGEGERFDRILVRTDGVACLSPERVDVRDVQLSDHLPVRAILRAERR